jgi:DNA-binding NarL/FixJ family response regulator
MKIKVLLADDHAIVRDGVAALLGSTHDIEVVAEASGGLESVEKVLEHAPDVVVMDLALPDMGGIEAIRRIRAKKPHVKVLVLTMHLDRNCVLESLEAGASGYLVKECAGKELAVAVRMVFADKPYLCAGATEIMLKKFSSGSASGQNAPELTKREQEVLKLTALGNNSKEIAFTLGISSRMIDIHRINIKKKLGLQNIAQLTTYAARNGLISIEKSG